jgi:hypothetical protein
MILYDRDIERERVRQFGLTYAMSRGSLIEALRPSERSLQFRSLNVGRLEAIASACVEARVCTTIHPSGETLATWLLDIGFSQVNPTHSGAKAAGRLFESVQNRPVDLHGVDELVRPLAEIVSQLSAPLDTDPMLTAVK